MELIGCQKYFAFLLTRHNIQYLMTVVFTLFSFFNKSAYSDKTI